MASLRISSFGWLFACFLCYASLISACNVNVGGTLVSLAGWDGVEWALPDATYPGTYQYGLSICAPMTQISPCTNSQQYMCQMTTKPASLQNTIIYAAATPTPTWSAYKGDISKGITFNGANGDKTGCSNVPRTATVNLICDLGSAAIPPNIDAGGSTVTASPDNCVYTANIKTSAVCGINGGGGGGGGSSGISGGSVFLIIFFVGAFVYVAGGCLYKRQKMGTTGLMESCPNVDFWAAIPGLVKDGAVFTYVKLRGLCDGGAAPGAKGTYENL